MAKREIPDGALLRAWDVIGAAIPDGYIEQALATAYYDLRKAWEAEQLQALRSREAVRRVTMAIKQNQNPGMVPNSEELAEEILDLLTTPRFLVSPDEAPD